MVEDFFQRHLAIQFGIQGQVNRPQPTASVGPQDAKTLAVAGGRPEAVGRRAIETIPFG